MEYFGPRRVRPSGPSRPRIRLGPRKAAHRPTMAALSVYPSESKGDGVGRGEPVVNSRRKIQRRTPAVLPAVIWAVFGLLSPSHGNTSNTQMLYLFLKISTHFKQSQYHRRPLGAEQQACGFYNNLDPLPSRCLSQSSASPRQPRRYRTYLLAGWDSSPQSR